MDTISETIRFIYDTVLQYVPMVKTILCSIAGDDEDDLYIDEQETFV